jgi:hypothetical protein
MEWGELWRGIILGADKSWVAFENGTCVVLTAPDGDLGEQARALLAERGTVHVGSPAGDFGVIELPDARGWVVTGHHPDILTYVAPDELTAPSPTDLAIGLTGRGKRDQDARELRVAHVEDRRR